MSSDHTNALATPARLSTARLMVQTALRLDAGAPAIWDSTPHTQDAPAPRQCPIMLLVAFILTCERSLNTCTSN